MLIKHIKKVLKEKILSWNIKQMKGRLPRVMVVGVPNVGKSSFVNNILNRKSTKTENRAGVTLVNSWHNVSGELEICDTPGVLLPKMDQFTGEILAFLGLIKDNVYDKMELSLILINFLKTHNFLNKFLLQIFKKGNEEFDFEILNMNSDVIIEKFAKARNFLFSGNKLNLELASEIFLNDFKNGKFGTITLEKCILK